MEKITKDMLIGDVINKYPEAAGIMLGYGLHCVGCSANPFDTIESGCMSHGIDEETVDNLVNELNKMPVNKEEKIVSITEIAAEKFLEFMREENNVKGVRLSVLDNGNSLQYGLDLVDKQNNSETIFEDNGIKIFVEKDFVEKVKGVNIDFVENERGSGFKIGNQNSKAGGCGSGCGCHD